MKAYLQLLRPPNVMTAVADVLAGYAVSGARVDTPLAWLVLSTACLYAGGVTLNDYFDRTVDALERPERPIPSGRVPARHAAVLGAALLVIGTGAARAASAAAGLLAAAIAALVLLYDIAGKRHPLLGPPNMGLCRALNLALGMAAVPAVLSARWPLALIPLVYITTVTALSRGEVHGGRRRVAGGALISLGLVLAALAALAFREARPSIGALALTALFGWRVLPPFRAAYRDPAPPTIRRAVKAGVLSLVLLDAAIAVAYGGALYGAAILLMAVAAGLLSRLFAVT